MIKAHHDYKPKYAVPVLVFQRGELNNLLDSLHIQKYLLLKKYNYQIFLINKKY